MRGDQYNDTKITQKEGNKWVFLTFKGGVHPAVMAKIRKGSADTKNQTKEILVYPLSQHIGAPASLNCCSR